MNSFIVDDLRVPPLSRQTNALQREGTRGEKERNEEHASKVLPIAIIWLRTKRPQFLKKESDFRATGAIF